MDTLTASNPIQIAQSLWGVSSFRLNQESIIASILTNQKVFAVMPTGGGKSLCYIIPGIILGEMTLIISPLISLMKDQVDNLNRRQLKATYLNSTLDSLEIQTRLQDLQEHRYQFLFVAPEKLLQIQFRNLLLHLPIKLMVIDEAHCISEWGYSFRPAYRELGRTIQTYFPSIKILALTATAPKAVENDIQRLIGGPTTWVTHRFPVIKDNLQVIVKPQPTITDQHQVLFTLLKKHQSDCGIIYALTRREANYIAQLINTFNFHDHYPTAVPFHAGLDVHKRNEIQNKFLNNEIRLIVATSAFGMGIDKPNIKYVIHLQLPPSVEQYIQEIGRAGRDGSTVSTYLIHLPSQKNKTLELLLPQWKTATPQRKKVIQYKVAQMDRLSNCHKCRWQFIQNYFDSTLNTAPCGHCDRCLSISPTIEAVDQQLLSVLIHVRNQVSQQYKIHPFEIATDTLLTKLCLHVPQTLEQLSLIPGVGTGWLERYSEYFLPILQTVNLGKS